LWNVIMKSTGIAWLLVVALAVSLQGPVQARPASHFGTPSSMRSGFSSQKSLPAPSAPPSTARSSGPGSFGKAAAPQADLRSSSASSRDMEQNAAQANALKTLDARRAAASAPPPVPPLNDTASRAPQSAPMPVYNQPAYPQQLPQPIIVHQHGSGLMSGVVGFMLGRAMSQQTQMSYPPYGQSYPGAPAANSGATVNADGSTAPAAAAAMTPVPVPKPSFAATVLRVFFWLALMSGLVWLVVYMVWKVRRIRAANAAHYSFERN
jgi:hypothetical protein